MNLSRMSFLVAVRLHDGEARCEGARVKFVPKMPEAYEICEYGRLPIEEDFELLMGD